MEETPQLLVKPMARCSLGGHQASRQKRPPWYRGKSHPFPLSGHRYLEGTARRAAGVSRIFKANTIKGKKIHR